MAGPRSWSQRGSDRGAKGLETMVLRCSVDPDKQQLEATIEDLLEKEANPENRLLIHYGTWTHQDTGCYRWVFAPANPPTHSSQTEQLSFYLLNIFCW